MYKYYFRQCTVSKLDDLFGLRKTFASQILARWLQAEVALSEKEKSDHA